MDFDLETLNEYYSNAIQGIKHWRFGNKSQLAFLEDLNVLITDGIPANRAVEMMEYMSTGLTREVASSIAQKISEGQTLAEGMREWFSLNVVEIIRVGEEGGALAETLQSAIKTMRQQSVALGAFFAALGYPLIVIALACGIIIYLNGSIFEQFKQIKPIEEWPEAGTQLVAIANIIQHWWWAVILIIIIIIFSLKRIMSNYVGELRPILDTIPPFTFYKRFAAARLIETLGLLVANGLVFKSAIKVMQHQASPYLGSHLLMMEHLLGMGKTNIADVLATGLIDSKDLMRLRVLAEVKGFEHSLIRMGIQGAEEATKTMKLIARVAGGILLTIGALLILLIIRGIYSTGMSMTG